MSENILVHFLAWNVQKMVRRCSSLEVLLKEENDNFPISRSVVLFNFFLAAMNHNVHPVTFKSLSLSHTVSSSS